MNPIGSPFIVPLGAFVVAIVAIVSGAMGQAHARRMKAEQRMAMLQRGMTVEQIDQLLKHGREDDEDGALRIKDPMRSLGNARRTAVILTSIGLGFIVFGWVLTEILRVREVLAVSAVGLIPLAIGIGFFVDYNLQQRELSRFGLEVGADSPANQRPR